MNVCLEIDSLNNFSSILDTLSLSPPLISALPPSTLNPVNHLAVLPLFLDPSSLSISCPEPRALVLTNNLSSSPPSSSLSTMSAPTPALPPTPSLTPSGPICAFGSRLAFTYFPSPTPPQEQLNSLSTGLLATGGGDKDGSVYWFTIDDQLVYLSFFQDYGPLNIGCL